MKKKIRPLTDVCQWCKKGDVTDHHWICNDCWARKEKQKFREWSQKLNKEERKSWKKLTREEKLERIKQQGFGNA